VRSANHPIRRLLEYRITMREVGDRMLRIVAGELDAPEIPEWWRLQVGVALTPGGCQIGYMDGLY
jgi:hypothetical protein